MQIEPDFAFTESPYFYDPEVNVEGSHESRRHDAPQESDRSAAPLEEHPSSPSYQYRFKVPTGKGAGINKSPLHYFADKVLRIRGKRYASWPGHLREMRTIIRDLSKEQKSIINGGDREQVNRLAGEIAVKVSIYELFPFRSRPLTQRYFSPRSRNERFAGRKK
jgi:hypothetical protein